MSEAVRFVWTGQTRDAVHCNLVALREMGDVSASTTDAFDVDSREVVFADVEAAKQALDEMTYIADMGHPEIHEPTLREKIATLREEVAR